jgi:hypothetical protein
LSVQSQNLMLSENVGHFRKLQEMHKCTHIYMCACVYVWWGGMCAYLVIFLIDLFIKSWDQIQAEQFPHLQNKGDKCM